MTLRGGKCEIVGECDTYSIKERSACMATKVDWDECEGNGRTRTGREGHDFMAPDTWLFGWLVMLLEAACCVEERVHTALGEEWRRGEGFTYIFLSWFLQGCCCLLPCCVLIPAAAIVCTAAFVFLFPRLLPSNQQNLLFGLWLLFCFLGTYHHITRGGRMGKKRGRSNKSGEIAEGERSEVWWGRRGNGRGNGRGFGREGKSALKRYLQEASKSEVQTTNYNPQKRQKSVYY